MPPPPPFINLCSRNIFIKKINSNSDSREPLAIDAILLIRYSMHEIGKSHAYYELFINDYLNVNCIGYLMSSSAFGSWQYKTAKGKHSDIQRRLKEWASHKYFDLFLAIFVFLSYFGLLLESMARYPALSH
jgi:hypothetical protein